MFSHSKLFFFSNKNFTISVCSALNAPYVFTGALHMLMAQYCRSHKSLAPNMCSQGPNSCAAAFHGRFISFPPWQILFHILSWILKNI